MKSHSEIEQILERLGNDWPAECTLADDVSRRIESEVVHLEPAKRSFRATKYLLAAAGVIAVVGLWWFLRGEGTLYAQAIEGIKTARTVYLAATLQREDGESKEIGRKAWYEQGVGFREEIGSEIRLGNPMNFWTYQTDSNLAIRSKSRGLDEIVDRMLNIDALEELKKSPQAERYAEGDRTVDGQPCRAYLVTYTNPAGYPANPQQKVAKWRTLILLDDRSRIARTSRQSDSNGDWKTVMTIDWKYDVPIDRALFEPNFGEQVKIVDADKVFDEFVDLDKAIYREQRAGLWFAIHRLQRFHDGIFIVSSVRGTDETLKKYPIARRLIQPGQLIEEGLATNYEASPQGNGYFRIDLARADYEGINVCWWMLVPRGVPLDHFDIAPGLVKLPVGITPKGEFAKDKFAVNGVIQHLTWEVRLSLPAAKVLPSTEMIAAETYNDQVALEVIPYRRLDLGVKENFKQFGRPENTTVGEFERDVVAHLRWWRNEDVEFQLEGQFTESAQADLAKLDPAHVVEMRVIGLSYEPSVDDATLARVAKRTNLRQLYLDGTKITDAGLKQLAGLKELRDLSLANTAVSDAGLKELEGLTALRSLNLEDTKVSDQGIERLKRSIPELKVER